MEKKYDFKEIPPGWKFCFNEACPMHGECLRYQSGLEIPEDRVWGSAVFPTALKDGKCEFYRKDEKVRLATGFLTSNPMQNGLFIQMRYRLSPFLGGNGTYYLYRNGKKWLTPEQQRGIQNILRKVGYKEEVIYAEYKEAYNFL